MDVERESESATSVVKREVVSSWEGTLGYANPVASPLQNGYTNGANGVVNGGNGFTSPTSTNGSVNGSLNGGVEMNGNGMVGGQLKRKQKRNKPTLSCEECGERKTKCDRSRPNCIACQKRQTVCKYAHSPKKTDGKIKASRDNPDVLRKSNNQSLEDNGPSTNLSPTPYDRPGSTSSASSMFLLSHVPHSHPTASNVFGIGGEHPFANYWTCHGGLPETITVLPDKSHADQLLENYFEYVDPVYPMLHRQTFYADYHGFWSGTPAEKDAADGDFIALLFVMLALGTQFVTATPMKERQHIAEFYVSAAHQSLRIYSYMNKTSLRSISTMILITYFLINDNHASDGWAFAGVLIRQAYAMGLHRDPNIVVPKSSIFDKQQRRKLWQAVLLQDTFLTVLLSLPPSATHTDVKVDNLIDDDASIAHSNPNDTAYIRCSWHLANLTQVSICCPRSLGLPIANTIKEKTDLIAKFNDVYLKFDPPFHSWTVESLKATYNRDRRIVKQTLFLTSNYWHNVMLIHASKSAEVPVDRQEALIAANLAIGAFFLLCQFFGPEAKVWWVFNHRAFLEATCIGNILQDVAQEPNGHELLASDPVFVQGKQDIAHMAWIMEEMAAGDDGSPVAATRVGVLKKYL